MFPDYLNESLSGSYCRRESIHSQHSITAPLPLFYHPFHSQQHQLLQRYELASTDYNLIFVFSKDVSFSLSLFVCCRVGLFICEYIGIFKVTNELNKTFLNEK